MSDDRLDWFLINASPDIRQQIEETPALHPRGARHSPIAGIALGNGDLDHVLGLFSLRESYPLVLYATDAVRRGIEQSAFVRTLQRFPGQLTWRRLPLAEAVPLVRADGSTSALELTALPVAGKLPVHLVGHAAPDPGDNVALRIRDRRTGRTLLVATAVAHVDSLRPHLAGVDLLLLDGTFWSEDEIVGQGLGQARAGDMAHQPIGGASGSLAALADVAIARRIYTHINNTNPLLREDSPERVAVEQAGWEVAHDRLELTL